MSAPGFADPTAARFTRALVTPEGVDLRIVLADAGARLSAFLLDATMAGLATCTLTHITELAASRDIVAGLIGHHRQDITPQVLVRIGRAPSIEDVPPPTPRRPVHDVFEVRAKDQ